jgi:hypothetical protein
MICEHKKKEEMLGSTAVLNLLTIEFIIVIV